MSDYFDNDDEEDFVFEKETDQSDRKYYMLLYKPAFRIKNEKTRMRRASKGFPLSGRGEWKKLNQKFDRRAIEQLCSQYYEYGDVIKVKITDNE